MPSQIPETNSLTYRGYAVQDLATQCRFEETAYLIWNGELPTQAQLDEMARGLVTLFAESDQVGGGAPTRPGLFTYSGAPAMPAAGVVVPGLAASISVSASVDPAQGGDVNLLRDGAISDPGNAAYVYNTSGAAGFSSAKGVGSSRAWANITFTSVNCGI